MSGAARWGAARRRAARRLPLLALAAVAGCQYLPVGPVYHRPSIEVPASYKEARDWKPAEPQDTKPRGNWWDLYEDADLDTLMRQVQVSNQNVLLAAAKYDQALALLGTARSGYFPTITADVSSTRSQSGGGSSTASASAAAAGKSTTTQDRVSLATNWEIDVWGRVRRTVESNRASAQASAGDLAAMLLSEQATLAQAYFQLRVTDLDLALLERSMDGYQKALEVTQNRYQAGVAQRSDVTQAQTQLENARAQWLDLGITRATLEHAIAVLIGKPPAALSIARKDETPAIPPIPLSLPSQLLGAFLAFSDTNFYPWYAAAPRVWPALTPAADQQLGGLIMWVIGGTFFLGAFALVFLRWVAKNEAQERRRYRALGRTG